MEDPSHAGRISFRQELAGARNTTMELKRGLDESRGHRTKSRETSPTDMPDHKSLLAELSLELDISKDVYVRRPAHLHHVARARAPAQRHVRAQPFGGWCHLRPAAAHTTPSQPR